MNKHIYAIRDCKVGSFAPPCLFENDSVAIRAFGSMVEADVKEGKGLLGSHPEDFCLYRLGSINLESGHIDSIEPVSLALASDFVR